MEWVLLVLLNGQGRCSLGSLVVLKCSIVSPLALTIQYVRLFEYKLKHGALHASCVVEELGVPFPY